MQSDKSDRIKFRARLALRAERALGLHSLPIALSVTAAPETPAPRATPHPAAPAAAAERWSKASPGSASPGSALPGRASPAAPTPGVSAPDDAPPDEAGGRPVRPRTTPSKPSAAAAALFGAPAAFDFVMPSDPFTAPVLPRDQKIVALKTLDQTQVHGCTKCRLHENRTQTVFGEGDPEAKIFFIGEGPGENEDLQGRPFVGKAGQLLDKMIQAMGLSRERVYIANIVKCRPPNNREPAPDETGTCTPYLMQQIEIVRPSVIVTLGKPATQFILQSKLSMSRLRGQWHSWRGIKVMPTYHPAYVLRSYTRQTREAVWSDLKQVLEELKLPLPSR